MNTSDVYVPQPSGSPVDDRYAIYVTSTPAAVPEGSDDRQVRTLVALFQAGGAQLAVLRFRQEMKRLGRSSSPPSMVLLGPRAGAIYPPIRLKPKPSDEDAMGRASGSASLGTGSTDRSGGLSLDLYLGILVLPQVLTATINGGLYLPRVCDPAPMVDALTTDLSEMMSALAPGVTCCRIELQSSILGPPVVDRELLATVVMP